MQNNSNASTAARRLTEAYIWILLAAFPLFPGLEGYANLTLHKYIFFAGTTILWLLGLVIAGFFSRQGLRRGRLGAIRLLLLVYLAFCLISGLFSPHGLSVILGAGRFDGLLTILLCVLIFLGVSRYARPKPAHLYAAALGAVLSCLVAILQLLGKNPLGLFPAGFFYYDAGEKFSAAFLGTIGNVDLFSAHLSLVLPLLGVFYIRAEKRPVFLLLALLPLSFCLFACGVAAGILALGLTVLVAAPFVINSGERLRRGLEAGGLILLGAFLKLSLAPLVEGREVRLLFSVSKPALALALTILVLALLRLIFRKKGFSARKLQVFLFSLSGCFILGGLALVYFFGDRAGGTIFELHELLHGRLDDRFGSSRILIWKKALALFPQRPLLGGGAGTLSLRLNLTFTRFVEETGKTLSTFVDNAHNDYLGILLSSGLPALLAYLAAQLTSLVQAVRRASPFALSLGIALFCYWVSAFFGLGLFLVSPMMWLLWGLLASELHS